MEQTPSMDLFSQARILNQAGLMLTLGEGLLGTLQEVQIGQLAALIRSLTTLSFKTTLLAHF